MDDGQRLIDQAAALFAGRTDAFGTEIGSCERVKNADLQQAWWQVWWGHFGGAAPIGIYPLRPDGTCSWGCIDVDVEDRHLTQAVYGALWELGVHPYVEVSRSKGYHLWWFYPVPVEGWVVRVLGLTAAHMVEAPTLEVNPKQFTLAKESVGNYVRLPYPGGLSSTEPPQRRCVIEEGERLTLPQFLAAVKFSHPAASHRAAIASPLCPAEYVLGVRLPPLPGRGPWEAPRGSAEAARQEAFGVAFRGAPVPSGTRDNQLFTVANLMWSVGLTEQEAEERMRLIWANQIEDRGSFPETVAVAKVHAVYRNRHGARPPYQSGRRTIGVSPPVPKLT